MVENFYKNFISEIRQNIQKFSELENNREPKHAVRRNLWSPKLTPNSPQSRIPVPRSSPKPQLKEIKSPNNSPLIPPKRARIFDANKTNNSPFKTQTSCPKTPMNGKIESTPKKSLLKRFLETATPAKSHTPRSITASTATKNITLTKYSDPQNLIEKLISTLSAKGIACKQKESVNHNFETILIICFKIGEQFFVEMCALFTKCDPFVIQSGNLQIRQQLCDSAEAP